MDPYTSDIKPDLAKFLDENPRIVWYALIAYRVSLIMIRRPDMPIAPDKTVGDFIEALDKVLGNKIVQG